MEFSRVARILLTLKQDSFDQSFDEADQPSKKRSKSESSTKPIETLSTRLARESLLRKIEQNEKDTQDT